MIGHHPTNSLLSYMNRSESPVFRTQIYLPHYVVAYQSKCVQMLISMSAGFINLFSNVFAGTFPKQSSALNIYLKMCFPPG